MIRVLIVCFIACLIFCSCSNKSKVENVVEGWCSMDTIYYKNQDIRVCLGSNALQLREGHESELPVAKDNCGSFIKNSYSPLAKIVVLESGVPNDTIPFRLKIVTKNEIFSGMHKIVFYKDEINKLLKMEIFSDSLYIVCRKGLFNFDKNVNLINELERESWTTRPKSPNSQ